MPAKVVDASVLAAWCFREPRADEARGLLEGFDLYAPVLLRYELASVARKKATNDRAEMDMLVQALETALALRIHWEDTDQVAVLRFAIQEGLTTYDASYLFLARELGVPLATFDERLERAVQRAT